MYTSKRETCGPYDFIKFQNQSFLKMHPVNVNNFVRLLMSHTVRNTYQQVKLLIVQLFMRSITIYNTYFVSHSPTHTPSQYQNFLFRVLNNAILG
jgi:hypothetical protein